MQPIRGFSGFIASIACENGFIAVRINEIMRSNLINFFN